MNCRGETTYKPLVACDILNRIKDTVYPTYADIKVLLDELNDWETRGDLHDCAYYLMFTK